MERRNQYESSFSIVGLTQKIHKSRDHDRSWLVWTRIRDYNLGGRPLSDEKWVLGRRGPGSTDQVFVDSWSFVHFVSGAILFLIGFDLAIAIVILIAWEVFENSPIGTALWRSLPRLFPNSRTEMIQSQSEYVGDSWGNMAFDVVFGILGWVIVGAIV
jgi:hypothetical protein